MLYCTEEGRASSSSGRRKRRHTAENALLPGAHVIADRGKQKHGNVVFPASRAERQMILQGGAHTRSSLDWTTMAYHAFASLPLCSWFSLASCWMRLWPKRSARPWRRQLFAGYFSLRLYANPLTP